MRGSLPPSKLVKLVAGEGNDWTPPARVPPDAARDLVRRIIRREEALRPATEREIAVALGRLAIHFWHPDQPEEIHRLAFEDWLEDLAEYPLVALNEAAREWRRAHPWAPRISEMRASCDAAINRRRTELLRLRFLAWCVEYHGGRCPRLLRRIGDRLVDYGDGLNPRMIQAALDGRTEFPPDKVLALPHAAPLPAPERLDFSQIFPATPPGEQPPPAPRTSARRKVSGFSRAEIAAGALDAPGPPPATPE